MMDASQPCHILLRLDLDVAGMVMSNIDVFSCCGSGGGSGEWMWITPRDCSWTILAKASLTISTGVFPSRGSCQEIYEIIVTLVE